MVGRQGTCPQLWATPLTLLESEPCSAVLKAASKPDAPTLHAAARPQPPLHPAPQPPPTKSAARRRPTPPPPPPLARPSPAPCATAASPHPARTQDAAGRRTSQEPRTPHRRRRPQHIASQEPGTPAAARTQDAAGRSSPGRRRPHGRRRSPGRCPHGRRTDAARFIFGFFLGAIPWYIGALLLWCSRVDYREKPGYVACTVAAQDKMSGGRRPRRKGVASTFMRHDDTDDTDDTDLQPQGVRISRGVRTRPWVVRQPSSAPWVLVPVPVGARAGHLGAVGALHTLGGTHPGRRGQMGARDTTEATATMGQSHSTRGKALATSSSDIHVALWFML
ncbi:uncharacterized protein LOC110431607 [Sorghum bicolor]|uniref:uncharacterized protein LOC110431607 n=1 Tax=Sorghum bicolor TaxID=4558 RepID=UPI000B424DED|nr:uncharacterized protein LOC110431607 [Sorghum bicolor]|eukprot:XP_021306431.1 uncharacterized protein LOC110431607 [Sorghum bicolor]